MPRKTLSQQLKKFRGELARKIVKASQDRIVNLALDERTLSLEDSHRQIEKKILAAKGASLCRPGQFELRLLDEFLTRRASPDPRLWGTYRDETLRISANNAGVLAKSDFDVDTFSLSYLESLRRSDFVVTFPWTEWAAGNPFAALSAHIRHENFDPIHALERDVTPWTQSLRGKRVAVVSSFSKTIAAQVSRLDDVTVANQLFNEPTFIPVAAPVTFAGVQTEASWDLGLNRVTADLASIDYDVALIAAGSYGPAIANFVKFSGKVGIHVGGMLQLMFGIHGNRWKHLRSDGHPFFGDLKNWVEPAPSEVPAAFRTVEGGAYW